MIVNDNILEARKSFGYSQEEVANKLNVSRQTYNKVENGSSDLSTSQLEKLAKFYGLSITDFYYEMPNYEKFKEMVIYILSKFKDHGLTKTKLAKLLYLSDFYHYYTHFESISNVDYRCKDYGPLAEPFLETIDDMYEGGELRIDILDEGAQMIKLTRSINPNSISLLNDEEKIEIDQVCEKWKNARSQELISFTHKQKPWMACRPNEVIPYDLILQEDPDNVF